MIKGFVTSSVLCSAVVFSQIAYAIVDVESLRERAGNEIGYSSSGNLQASGASGNSDRADVSFSALLQYLGDGFSNLFVIGSEYGETSGDRSADEQIIHIRHTRILAKGSDWEVFSQWQQNEFTRLEERTLLGSGIRLGFGDDVDSRLYLGLGAFYESTRNEDESDREMGRSNIYVSHRKKTSKDISLITTAYLQNKLDDPNDQRAIGSFSMSIPATNNLDFTVSLNVEHDSRSPIGVEKTDWTYKTGFGWKF
ncbi:DUF481 domain-containing protein [Burkholderiales bacterium]|nr:DUF481 domain-containing protein [Burkholderiales bacterium]